MERTRENLDAARRVKGWLSEAPGVPADAVLIALEVACQQPGCPPIETMTAVLMPAGNTVQRKIPRPIQQVTADDVAAAWGDALRSP